MYTSIRAASKTLTNLLLTSFQADLNLASLFGAAGSMQVSLATPEEMSQGSINGLSVWLYRIVRDEEHVNDPPLRIAYNLLQPPPLPLRLHYLLTPLANGPAGTGPLTEQLLMGKTLQVLHDHPKLRGADLQDDLIGAPVELYVRLESLNLQEIYEIWNALEISYRLSVSYEVSVVNIDAAVQPQRVSPVLAARPDFAQIVGSS